MLSYVSVYLRLHWASFKTVDTGNLFGRSARFTDDESMDGFLLNSILVTHQQMIVEVEMWSYCFNTVTGSNLTQTGFKCTQIHIQTLQTTNGISLLLNSSNMKHLPWVWSHCCRWNSWDKSAGWFAAVDNSREQKNQKVHRACGSVLVCSPPGRILFSLWLTGEMDGGWMKVELSCDEELINGDSGHVRLIIRIMTTIYDV